MHVRITRGTFDAGGMDEEQLTALTREVADAVKGQAGFVSYLGGVDLRAGTLVAITTWQDEESANFPREALGPVVSQAVDLGIQLAPPETYDVRASV